MCDSMTKQYESASEGRKQELLLLDAIKVKVNEHYAKLTPEVVKRGELDNFKNTYKDKSKWVNKEFKG